MADRPKLTPAQTAAHYRALAAAAQRMNDMGHTTPSGGGGKPPRRGCWKPAALTLVGVAAAVWTVLYAAVDALL